ncbi:hypothetical protein PINS_up008647 [Pythium insidiosum]|nr:hypothetical protein PINS_up008647 [Pythium insidiosum]
MLSMRHVVFFKDSVQSKLAQLSDTADVLELWIKVQTLWMSLESVFTGGDIAKQMPLEAKKFAKIDKDWIKIMTKASEIGVVVACCSNELLRSTLPILFGELEKCQKSLEGYLEQKRKKFPRFYFVSNPLLLLILSRGSDPMSVQQYYEKIFDSIDQVVHEERERPATGAPAVTGGVFGTQPSGTTAASSASDNSKRKILKLKSIVGSDEEVIALGSPVTPDGNIEDWLGALEREMRRTMKTLCRQAAAECNGGASSGNWSLRDFVLRSCGQFALLGIQLSWTAECQDALAKCKSTKGIMTATAKRHTTMLSELSSWCLTDLGTKMTRTKVETLITIQVHQRDCFAELCRLYKEKKISDANDFEWLKQARFYWRPAPAQDVVGSDGACLISICDVDFKYAFEYLGCKERLVITPLTDRAYITLSQALGMHLGGAPAGPAGTGKTETVKDLGRSLGVFVIVTNCTDQQRYSDMAKIFKGLCQGGLWGCFDEFNRIELPVLSVVAQQVLAITNAKRIVASSFSFPGDPQPIGLHPDVAYFITMNPGYQGRQELPENLKALFRGVSMMVPDREIIIKVKLCSVGYDAFAELARKFKTLYGICEEQLSKQRHYDFGLRNILSVLRTAGATKRDSLMANEEWLLMTTLRDMNLSKLVAQDIPIFLALLRDIFPGVDHHVTPKHADMTRAVHQVLAQNQRVAHGAWVAKVLQFYETTLVRHGIIVVGPAGSGKSEIFRTLQAALGAQTRTPHKQIRMNPKAIRPEEMFGETDKLSGEWVDGVFASIWAKYNDRSRKDVSWIVCDGPVDAIWIENLNTVLDDNKILTLANGDRIPMTDNCKLMFEVEDLRNASPATVSRAGIIYVSDSDLDWQPVVQGWLGTRPESHREPLQRCVRQLATGLFDWLAKHCRPVLAAPRVALMQSCLALLHSLLLSCELSENVSDLDTELERLFIFSLAWTIGGVLDVDDRTQLHAFFAERSSQLPSATGGATIFDFFLHSSTLEWERWSLESHESPPAALTLRDDTNVASLILPTTDTTRTLFLLSHLHGCGSPVMLVGESGTGKSTLVRLFFETLQSPAPSGSSSSGRTTSSGEDQLAKQLIFSGSTTPGVFQGMIESELDKRGGKTFGPANGKKLTFFLDDLAMPAPNAWGDQPTLEVARQLIETSNLCFLDKDKRGDIKVIEDVRYLAAMAHPRGGKNDIPSRLKRHFVILNLLAPTGDVVEAIFGQLTRARFHALVVESDAAVAVPAATRKAIGDVAGRLATVSLQLWHWLRRVMLPTPQKFHYFFSLRELSRCFQGVLRVPLDCITSEKVLVRLWRHECERVFADRLVTHEDKQRFHAEIVTLCDALLQKGSATASSTAASGTTAASKDAKDNSKNDAIVSAAAAYTASAASHQQTVLFADFLREAQVDEYGDLVAEAPHVYEPAPSLAAVRTRADALLAQFNKENPTKRLQLILFDEALLHLLRISRVLGMAQNNMMLVGVGGSGKQSLARLASIIAGHQIVTIQITKAYNLASFLDDLRAVFKVAGQVGKSVAFVLTDAEIKDESFLEQINAFLATGEIPGLFPRDELTVMASELRSAMQKAHPERADTLDNLIRFFFDRVRRHLHLLLCLSPVSKGFVERCRAFPHLIAGCTINWFLPWPEEALVAVAQGYLDGFTIEAAAGVKDQLVSHMGHIHQVVVETCSEYFAKMRRHVFQTPRSFLHFVTTYKALYSEKLGEIQRSESSINIGLQKLIQGAQDVEKMKLILKDEEAKLVVAEAAANKMLENLQIKSLEAKRESDIVQKIKEQCQRDAAVIFQEKQDAETDLHKAQPFLDEAERAVSSIKPNDLNELKKLAKPGDIIKLIFDCVAILTMSSLQKVEKSNVTLGVGKEKKTLDFLLDSFAIVRTGMLNDTRFLQNIFHFSKYQKDNINDETMELMMPYMELEGFTAPVARNASKAAEGLFCWVKAMMMYHEASKVVKPKLEALRIAEGKFEAAQASLQASEEKLQKCQAVLTRLQEDFQTQMEEKGRVEEYALATKKKMEQATALINGLSGERKRWTEDSNRFVERKAHLVGDCALAAAFLSYCGPFNRDFRELLMMRRIPQELARAPQGSSSSKHVQHAAGAIPLTPNLAMDSFLVDSATISDWNLQGLPSDPLSTQNGILVARASRFPLLIDPQGQALSWVLHREAARLPAFGVASSTSAKLRDHIEFCVSEGKALVIDGVDTDVDPMLHPLLDKQFVVKAKARFINLLDRVIEYHDDFSLYLLTRLPNPHFPPELQARAMIVDFTVTQKGLEEQLLARVIQKEQRSLEEQLLHVQQDLNANTKALLALDSLLLDRLSANTGNLLDDLELITVLAETKVKATEVNDKISAAEDMKRGIDEKREHYRPVATRGSVLYFGIVDFASVNVMYQTSLDQFLVLFRRAIDVSEKASLISKRVSNIIDTLTYLVYRYVNRGLYERDKLSFLLMIALKILVTAESITASDITLFLKAGASRKLSSDQPKPFQWMTNQAWLNAVQLATEKPLYKNLLTDLERSEALWRRWYEDNEPEHLPLPDYEGILFDPRVMTANLQFHRLLLVRSLREDRTILAVNDFLRALESVEVGAGSGGPGKLPAMGPRFTEAVTDTVESVFNEMQPETPVLYLLSAGADPTESIELFARKKRQTIVSISMGEGQEVVAAKAITTAMLNGSWVLLQNCHLGLAYMETLDDTLSKTRETTSPEFRLFLTSEPHPAFPIALLQRATKVTNEPPAGLRAGMLRSYTVLVDQDKLDRIESAQWRTLLFAVCFLHSVVQERRKFGPLGFSVPYEFNTSDLSAATTFLEKHLYTSSLSWTTVQYMIAEVHYGGRITDEMDRRLFKAYCEAWFNPTILSGSFSFTPDTSVLTQSSGGSGSGAASSKSLGAASAASPITLFNYTIPDALDIEEYHRFISRFPKVDSPEIFGLHPNADLTFRVKEVTSLLNVLLETQPKDQTSTKGETREDVVMRKSKELIAALPESFVEDDCVATIRSRLGGVEVPLNIFLFQEIQRLQVVLSIVRHSLEETQRAILGEIALTATIRDTINAIFDGKVPRVWLYRAAGDEISWLASTLGLWFTGLTDRTLQLRQWLERGRPNSFWLAGFSNPQGFLTAMRQEVTRHHVNDRWALDDVVYHSEVTDYEKLEQIKQAPRDGILVHGLLLDGAAWNKVEGTLVEAEPKRLFAALPVVYVTATTKSQKKNRTNDYGPYGGYEAPCYRYALRSDRYYIFSVTLSTRDHRPLHWTLRGVALLCVADQ